MNTPSRATNHLALMPEQVVGGYEPLDLQPSRVFALGLSYASHCRETGESPQRIVFEKRCAPTHGGQIRPPDAAAMQSTLSALDAPVADWLDRKQLLHNPLLDYEVELGLVLREDVEAAGLAQPGFAPEIGFFLANDVTARAVQICGEGAPNRLAYWSAAKSFPGFLPCSIHCWVPGRAASQGLLSVRLETHVNAHKRQSASTLDLAWTVNEMLAMVCAHQRLDRLSAGTWILTGTPSGIALQASAGKRRLLSILPRRAAIALALHVNRRNESFLGTGDRISCVATGSELMVESAVV